MVELKTTAELDKVAADVLARHGAGSPFLNYHPRWAPTPFPAVLCVSVARPGHCIRADVPRKREVPPDRDGHRRLHP